MTPARQIAIWVFDSHCVLCDGGIRYTLRHEKTASTRFVAMQSPEGRALAQAHGVDADDPTTFLFIENGNAFQKSDAVIALSRHLNGPARLIPLAKVFPKGLRDRAYEIVAKHRYRLFGRLDTCSLPDSANSLRFTLR